MASNRNVLKRYAPQARLDFIQAVTNRASLFGITKAGSAAGEVQGDLFILNGKAFPRSVANQRARLIARIARDGFAQVMEAVAYTWFNRFLAIRYMELHHYLDHGCRVLSHPAGHDEPELMEKAATINLPGLNRDEIVNLKLDGTKDEQIYRRLLIAQCNDLHRAMPFLFEKIDDETELLLPENLLQSDSIVRKLVNEIDEAEWQEIEIIGWLYQFYISEKKDQVIGKVVKSEDIPAATQLFTPNWIVKYMVQNSLGAQWLATYPDSGIRSGMEYYIAPAEQTPDVQAQIDAITPKLLDPEAITLIDPAVGSGHILVEAYDLFRAIYLERGYTKREAARAILTKNLFGLDIDDRAAQMAGFALLMKACADDRTVLRSPPKLNVLALQDSEGLDAGALAKALLPQERFEMVSSGDLLPETLSQPTLSAQQPTSAEAKAIKALVALFDGAKTFGSLITVTDAVMKSLPSLDALLAKPLTGDLLRRQSQADAQEALKPLVELARVLGGQYDCVVANPPYMGSAFFNEKLSKFASLEFPAWDSELFSCFIKRCLIFNKYGGISSLISNGTWMFLPTFQAMRWDLMSNYLILSIVDNGRGVWGSDHGTCCYALRNFQSENYNSSIKNLSKGKGKVQKIEEIRQKFIDTEASSANFSNSKDRPISASASAEFMDFIKNSPSLNDWGQARQGIKTGDIAKFLRFWHEVSSAKSVWNCSSAQESKSKPQVWYPCNKGGDFQKWYGNLQFVLDWESDGCRIRNFKDENGKVKSRPQSTGFFFKLGITWSTVTMGNPSFRLSPTGRVFESGGSTIFPKDNSQTYYILACLNSYLGKEASAVLSPKVSLGEGAVSQFPVPKITEKRMEDVARLGQHLTLLFKEIESQKECSPEFTMNAILRNRSNTINQAMTAFQEYSSDQLEICCGYEDAINDIIANELGHDLRAPTPRNWSEFGQHEFENKSVLKDLISYAIGCVMGRYSLVEPGLIYAHAGGDGFDLSRYGAFTADDDGIIPLTEEQWFPDDAAMRIEEFLGIAWPDAPVMDTLATLMDGLSMGNAGEPRAALRSYLSKQFYKDHLQTYKNRPIYWLFSSGKHKAFEALVYLHRYNEGTLARMRTNHVTPLMGKLQQRISDLVAEIATSSSSAEKTRKSRDKDKIAKQLIELRAFDEELRHLADQRIALDLDDGVKVNYARFGSLLAFKDKVCPKKKGEDE